MTNNAHLIKGIFLVAIALAFGLGSLRYPTGNLGRAGPGLFPMLISSLLFLLGIAIITRSFFAEKVKLDAHIRNIAIIIASLAGFALLSMYVNMIVGIAFLVFCSGMAASSYSVMRNLKLTVALVLVAVAFWKLLGLQLPLY